MILLIFLRFNIVIMRARIYFISGNFFLQVYHIAEGREKNPRFFDEDLEDHQPFPTLQTVLQELEQHVGCNIEIKWTMQLKVRIFLMICDIYF